MKKKFMVVGAACLITLGGAAYQVYADQIESSSSPIVIEAADPALPNPPVSAEPNERSKESLFFPPQLSVPLLAESSDHTLTRRSLSAGQLETEHNNRPSYQAVYLASNGTEYFAAQHPLDEIDAETVIRDIKDFYNEPIQDTQIGGKPAVYIDGQFRKVVHFFADNESLRVSSYYGSIEDTLAVAGQIAARNSR